MKLLDYDLVISLKARVAWLAKSATLNELSAFATGAAAEWWWVHYPDHAVYLHYQSSTNQFKLTVQYAHGTSYILLINKETILDLINRRIYGLEDQQNSDFRS